MKPIKQITILLALWLLLAASVSAATITIAATTTAPGSTYPTTPTATATLRIYASATFTANDGTVVMGSTVGSGAFYKQVNCTISAGVITIPSFTILSNTDAVDNQLTTYTAVFYDSKGVRRDTFFSNFRVPITLGTSITWAQLRLHNAGQQPWRDTNVYTRSQVDLLVSQVAGINTKATTTSEGIVRIGSNPVDAAHPIAVETGDSRLSVTYNPMSSPYNAVCDGATVDTAAFQSLLAVIGSTPAKIKMPGGRQCVVGNLTIPANVVIDFTEGGAFKGVNSTTLTYLSVPLAAVQQIFYNFNSGQATISFTGNKYLGRVYPQWWGMVADGSNGLAPFVAAVLACPANGTVYLVETDSYYRVNLAASGVVSIITKNITIEGGNPNVTLKLGPEASTSAGTYILFQAANGVDLTVKNLTMTGPTDSGGHEFRAVHHLSSTGSLTLDHVTTTLFDTTLKTDNALTLGGITVTVDHCKFTGPARNFNAVLMLTGDLATVYVRNSTLYYPSTYTGGPSGYLLYCSWSSNLAWVNNRALGAPKGYAIHPEGGTATAPKFWYVTDSEFVGDYGAGAILTNKYAKSVITDNTITPSSGIGIIIRNSLEMAGNSLNNASVIEQNDSQAVSINVHNNTLVDSVFAPAYTTAPTVRTFTLTRNEISCPNLANCLQLHTAKATYILDHNNISGATSAQVLTASFTSDMKFFFNDNYFNNSPGVKALSIIPVGFIVSIDTLSMEQNTFLTEIDALSIDFSILIAHPNVQLKRAIGSNIASAGNILVNMNADTYVVTGSTTINNIWVQADPSVFTYPQAAFGGTLKLIGDTGSTFALGSGGNIVAEGGARTAKRMIFLQFIPALNKWAETGGYSGAFSTISVTGQITSTLAPGTAPLVVSSTTNIPNLNASSLNGATMAVPGAIGGTTPNLGTFTIVKATNGVSNFFKGSDVASAATITASGNLFHVTGTTTITSVSGSGVVAGTCITIIFDGVLTFTDGSNLKLAGDFATSADDSITIVYDGTNWYEVIRSVN